MPARKIGAHPRIMIIRCAPSVFRLGFYYGPDWLRCQGSSRRSPVKGFKPASSSRRRFLQACSVIKPFKPALLSRAFRPAPDAHARIKSTLEHYFDHILELIMIQGAFLRHITAIPWHRRRHSGVSAVFPRTHRSPRLRHALSLPGQPTASSAEPSSAPGPPQPVSSRRSARSAGWRRLGVGCPHQRSGRPSTRVRPRPRRPAAARRRRRRG